MLADPGSRSSELLAVFDGISVDIAALFAVFSPVVPVLNEGLDIDRALGGPSFQDIIGELLERYVSVIQHASGRWVTHGVIGDVK